MSLNSDSTSPKLGDEVKTDEQAEEIELGDINFNTSNNENIKNIESKHIYTEDTNSDEKTDLKMDQSTSPIGRSQNLTATQPTAYSNIPGATMNFVNSIVGAGIIGLPYALYHSGFVFGVFLLLFVGYLTSFGVKKLVMSGVKVRKYNFEEVMEYAFGPKGFYIVCCSMIFVAYGAMCAYHVVIGDTIPPILKAVKNNPFHFLQNRPLTVFLYSTLFMLPLSLLKNMDSLKFSSSLSILAVVIIVLLVAIKAPSASHVRDDNKYTIAKPTWFAGVGTMSFAFVCQHSSFIVYNSLKNNTAKRWYKTTNYSISISLILCLVLAISGYLNFQSDTKGDILNNFKYDVKSINVARALLAFTMVFTYPMECFVARHCIMKILLRKNYINHNNKNKFHYIIVFILWTTSLAIGASLNDLGVVLELVGVIGASLVGYILPGLIPLRVYGFNHLKSNFYSNLYNKNISINERILHAKDFLIPIFLVAFGSIVFIFGTVTVFLVET